MSLSVAIAVHNEENNIIRVLESVYDWASEIVIVDGASTDKTVEEIRLFEENRLRNTPAKPKVLIYNESHEAMFHKNKQKAIERCTGSWILQLDADEVVSDDLQKEIVEVLKSENSLNTKYVAYWIPRLNYFLGKPLRNGGQYPDYTIRLYKNGVAHFPCKSIHENVEIHRIDIPRSETARNQDQIGHLTANLLHYPYPTFNEYLNKWSRYAILEAKMLYKKGVRPSVYNFILYMGIYPKWWFFWTYIRHKGFADGFAGFIFSLFSALRFWVTYTKLYEFSRQNSPA